MVDHRAGAGLSEEVARLCGYDPAMVKAGTVYEVATVTCSHCKFPFPLNRSRTYTATTLRLVLSGGVYCKKCDHYICGYCHRDSQAPDYVHTPFDKLVDAVMDAAARGEVLGSPPSMFHSKILIP